jgi:hypothetical protein
MCNRLWAGGPCEEGTGPGREAVDIGLGHILALYYCSSTSHQTH